MKLSEPLVASAVAAQFQATCLGDGGRMITGINEMNNTVAGDITFVDHPKYYARALQSAASVVFVNARMEAPEGKTLLLVEDPFSCYNQLAHAQYTAALTLARRHPEPVIGEGTTIGKNTSIAEGVTIGKNCVIGSNVSIGPFTVIGNNTIIHSGAVVGSDAFYFKSRGTHFEKMFSIGRVVIGDAVEIGANTTIDAGVSSDTVIGNGTKIDNLVQIAHDVKIGSHCLLCAQVGIAGNTRIGNHVKMMGKSAVVQNIVIEDHVTVLGDSNVNMNLKAGKTYLGSPCDEVVTTAKQLAAIKQLPAVLKKIAQWDKPQA